MKKLIPFLVLSLIITNTVISQNTVEYDFKTKSLDTIRPVKIGENCVFKVNNINKFIYEVKIKSSQSEFYSKPTGMLANIFQFEKIDSNSMCLFKDEKEFVINIISENKSYTSNIMKLNDKVLTNIYDNAKCVYDAFYKLEELKKIKNKLIELYFSDGLSYEMVLKSINELSVDYYITNQFELIKSYNDSYYNYRKSFDSIYCLYDIRSIEYLNDSVIQLNKKYSETNYNKLFDDINHLYINLKNENNYFIVSDPIQAKEDIINYQIIITPLKENDSLHVFEKRDFNIEVPIYGGVKIDFSTGFFVTNNLYNRKYSISNYLADSSMKVISQDKNNSLAQFSLGALIHISKRCNKNFKPALTFGLGLNSTDLTNLQAFLGLSAMLGSNERFIISTGLSLANVDYLKGKYSLETPTINLHDDTPLTEKVIKAGWFISFTYNLTSKR